MVAVISSRRVLHFPDIDHHMKFPLAGMTSEDQFRTSEIEHIPVPINV